MSSNSNPLEPVAGLRHCRVGANPIIWTNDDFPELGDATSLDQCLAEMHEAGYAGSELGRKYPRAPDALRDVLKRHQLDLVSGWHSTHLAERDYADEERRFLAHVALLRALDAKVVIVAECSRCIHGQADAPLGFEDAERQRLSESEWAALTRGLSRLCERAAAAGLVTVYHHHMGTVIQTESELERLLAAVPALRLLLDPGHLAFAGIDPLAITRRHRTRIGHVHLKSVRADVAARARADRWSFSRAVRAGVFTIPGEGIVDFPSIFRELAAASYAGWFVVEAEEDPALAPPLPKALRARAFVREHTGL